MLGKLAATIRSMITVGAFVARLSLHSTHSHSPRQPSGSSQNSYSFATSNCVLNASDLSVEDCGS